MTDTDQTVPPPWPDQLGKGETRNRLMAMKVTELQSIADYEGIKTGPKKEDTVNKIMAVWFDKARPDFPPPAPMTPPPPPSQSPTLPLGNVVYPAPQPVGGFERRVVKQELKAMTTAQLQGIADQEGIKPDSRGAVLDRHDMIPLILDVWQERAFRSLPWGVANKPAVEESRTPADSPAQVEVPPTWPDKLGQQETLRRLNSMKTSELNAIARSERIKVGPKKADTAERILAHWREHGMAQPFSNSGPVEVRTGESVRVTRIKQTQPR